MHQDIESCQTPIRKAIMMDVIKQNKEQSEGEEGNAEETAPKVTLELVKRMAWDLSVEVAVSVSHLAH